ncbi:Imm70 family immunity protein [Frateuria defendens]|uniref:Imm70 family immunity protein n=1 Tax=Frateuria defendens TaxID=2219559 RepID=UPI0009E5E4EA|nr:Imm70 family immunity protein [Frateuria defendens]
MGLYLCIFDGEEEIDGVEVGSYADFNFFRDAVVAAVEGGQRGSRCPTLVNHHDSDGEWLPDAALQLIGELDLIAAVFSEEPPLELDSLWKKKVATAVGLVPKNLLDCFFDIDGEPLLGRLRGLAEQSVKKKVPILFQ